MKKSVNAVLCLVLVLSIFFTFAACDSNAVTRYNLTSMVLQDVTIDIESLKPQIGDSDMYLELNSDGTAILKMDEEITEMQWDSDNIWPTNNKADIFSLTIDGNVVTMEQGGTKMVFKK